MHSGICDSLLPEHGVASNACCIDNTIKLSLVSDEIRVLPATRRSFFAVVIKYGKLLQASFTQTESQIKICVFHVLLGG